MEVHEDAHDAGMHVRFRFAVRCVLKIAAVCCAVRLDNQPGNLPEAAAPAVLPPPPGPLPDDVEGYAPVANTDQV